MWFTQYSGRDVFRSFFFRSFQCLPCQKALSQNSVMFGGMRKSGLPGSTGYLTNLMLFSRRISFIAKSSFVFLLRILAITSLRFLLLKTSRLFLFFRRD